MLNAFLFIETSSMSNPMVIMLVIIMFILLIAIATLANVVLGAATWHREQEKEKEAAQKNNAVQKVTTALVTGLLLLSAPAFAQDATPTAPAAAGFGLEGVSSTAFYLMAGVIVIELLVLFSRINRLAFSTRKR